MGTPAAPAVVADRLCVSVGAQMLLRDISLRIDAGERVAVVGHNGAGKSTLLRALTGFIDVQSGALRVLDADIADARQSRRSAVLRGLRRRVAQVHQGLALVGRLSVLDNVLVGGAARVPAWRTWLRRWPRDEQARAERALARVGMLWAAGRRTDSLSGGERQKVAIARALQQDAPLLLADEPTASLDAEAADEIIELLRALVAERDATLVCVLHDLARLPHIADRVIALRGGQIVLDAPVKAETPTQLRGILRK